MRNVVGRIRLTKPDTAWHEAGHAVMAWMLGFPHVRCVVHPDRTGDTSHGTTWALRRDPIKFALVALAGHETEVAYRRRKVSRVPAGDFDNLRRGGFSDWSINVMRSPCVSIVTSGMFSERVGIVAKALIEAPFGTVLNVSKILGKRPPKVALKVR